SVKEERSFSGDSKGVATPGFQGVLHRSLELAQLGSGDVLPGDKTRGFIAFDIAPGASTVMISTPLMQEAARIQIPG
ncbi:UNVERIFIED_ORG: hypothetical protein ABIB19_003990, partial [Arthrobacter sp. UYEF10]